MGKNLVAWGGVMQLSNDTSKTSTSPPYLVKNERSLKKRHGPTVNALIFRADVVG